MSKISPYGSWDSPITASFVANGSPRYDFTSCHNDSVYWVESRPWEAGRCVIVQQTKNGTIRDLIPQNYSARSSVHEYGGKPYIVLDNTLVFVNANDQQLYCVNFDNLSITAVPNDYQKKAIEYSFADFSQGPLPNHVLAVCEIHTPKQTPENLIVDICLSTGKLTRLCEGDDFYAYPRLSPNKQQLSWISWNHPNMPWDENQLCLADILIDNNDNIRLSNSQQLIANQNESIFQPQWDNEGHLLFVSDRNNWWNLFQFNKQLQPQALLPMQAECATPLWSLGMSTFTTDKKGQLFFTYSQKGNWHLGKLVKGAFEAIPSPFTDIYSLSINKDQLVFIAATQDKPYAVYTMNLDDFTTIKSVNTAHQPSPETTFIAYPKPIQFSTDNADTCYGFFYPPANKNFEGPSKELPPLIVVCHGGPTGATSSAYNPKIQYWTSRGFAVADINYRGSTGFGRAYRNKLAYNWGQADVADTIYAVKYLSKQGLIDSDKAIIRGSSAGGYTVLAALCFHNTFKAGASLYGIGDLEILVRDTHKFESHYLEKLIGPYPEQKEKYQQLSPLHHAKKINCPVIFFQGLLDKVVPPPQAEAMVEKLNTNGQITRYVTFPDEAHGFRKAANIEAALHEELMFYTTVFKLQTNQTS